MSERSSMPALSRERWETLEPLLDVALALSGEERERFLNRTGESDAALRQELSDMLAACERLSSTDQVLARPAAARFASLWEDADGLARLESALADRYTFERETGRGGMAVVYRARDLRHGRPVALKVLRTTLTDESPARFRREVALVANLQHPHIVPVFDSGESAGRLWFTMPFVEGESLGTKLRREGPLDIPEAIRLVREIADALDYAHARGVIHRDLKPDNVLMSGGHAVIADFGVAKAIMVDRESPDSNFPIPEAPLGASITAGTPAYMAPEQVAADPAVDHRADLYALGVIAYQLLSGVAPFTGTSRQELFTAHLREHPARVSAHRRDVAPELERLIMRLLEKRADDRPGSAAEILAALKAIDVPGREPAAPKPREPIGASRMRPRLLLAAAAIALVTGGSSWWVKSRPSPPPMRRVLVTPFVNTSGDTSLAYFGRVAAQWIADNLNQTEFVDVVSDIVKQSTATRTDIAAAATENQARLVVTGSYFVVGDSIRAQVEIHDVVTGTQLPGSRTVSSPRDTSSALLGPLGNEVQIMLANRLDPRIAEWSMGAAPQNMDAYRAFLEGLDLNAAGNVAEGLAQWQRAADLDSTYMQPLLHSAAMLSGPFPARADSLLKRVERRRALLTSGDRAWLDAIRANTDGRNFFDAAKEIVRAEPGAQLPHFFVGIGAVRVNRPNAALAAAKHINYKSGKFFLPWAAMVHFYVVTEANHQLGKHDVELAWARIATTLHPDSRDLVGMALRATAALGDIRTLDSLLTRIEAMPPSPNGRPLANWLLTTAGELAYHGRRAEAERVIRRAAAWQRTHPIESTPFWNARFELARTFYFLGEYRDAGRVLDSLIATEPQNPFYLAYAAASEARAGNAATAAALRNRLDALNRLFDHGETPYARALVAAELGDSSSAVTLLRQSLERGMPPDHFSIHADLMLSRLRGNAEFEQLLRPKD